MMMFLTTAAGSSKLKYPFVAHPKQLQIQNKGVLMHLKLTLTTLKGDEYKQYDPFLFSASSVLILLK
jgi:hypothetical protein